MRTVTQHSIFEMCGESTLYLLRHAWLLICVVAWPLGVWVVRSFTMSSAAGASSPIKNLMQTAPDSSPFFGWMFIANGRYFFGLRGGQNQ